MVFRLREDFELLTFSLRRNLNTLSNLGSRFGVIVLLDIADLIVIVILDEAIHLRVVCFSFS